MQKHFNLSNEYQIGKWKSKGLTPIFFLKIDTDEWQYSGYGVGFDSTGSFTHPDGGNCKNVIIFGADLGNSRHANNKTQSVLVLGHGLIQKINDSTIHAEKMYSSNFTVDKSVL